MAGRALLAGVVGEGTGSLLELVTGDAEGAIGAGWIATLEGLASSGPLLAER
jgi:hypothetical protein